MEKVLRISILFVIVFLFQLVVINTCDTAEWARPRGEIRVVESWRPDVNVLGHNVL